MLGRLNRYIVNTWEEVNDYEQEVIIVNRIVSGTPPIENDRAALVPDFFKPEPSHTLPL